MGLLILIGECNDACILNDVSVIRANSAELIDCPDAAVILGAGARVDIIRAALGVIANGDEPSENLPRGVQLITCGVSPKNTVSITSRTPEKITLSLNRSIRTKNGVIEPLELPVPSENALSEYEMMSRFAAGLLLEARS